MAFKRWFGLQKRIETSGEKARRLHGEWLTRAIARGDLGAPRIPTRKVSEGGYEHVRRSACGRDWADSWWSGAFRSTD